MLDNSHFYVDRTGMYMVKQYQNYSLPRDLAERIRKLIAKQKDLGYTSVSEFAKDAIRRLLDEYEKK